MQLSPREGARLLIATIELAETVRWPGHYMKSEADLLSRLQQTRGYQRFQEFEERQQTQEQLRRRLGAPAGKAPPVCVRQISLPELHFRNEVLVTRPQLPSQPSERKAPRVRIDLSKVQPLLPGPSSHTLRSSGRTASMMTLSTVRLSNPFEPTESFQYAVPDLDDLRTFNPFLRPKARNHFFPADLFHLDTTDYIATLFPVEGRGRWWLSDGTSEWRTCQILSFSEESGLFTIEWVPTGAKKRVSRFNVMFKHEKEETFLKNLAEASQRRDLLEAVLRYETRLTASTQKFPEITMPEDAEARILSLLSRTIHTDSEKSQVIFELHSIHRRNIVNFVFQVEHFVTKSLLTARPWMEQLQDYERKRGVIRKQMQDSIRSIGFTRAQKKLIRYRFDAVPGIRNTIKTFFERMTSIKDLNIYSFLLSSGQARTLPDLESSYHSSTSLQLAQISGLSVDASNALCENIPFPDKLARSCRL